MTDLQAKIDALPIMRTLRSLALLFFAISAIALGFVAGMVLL